jgi:hypothetical protein
MGQFRDHKPSASMVVAIAALVVAITGTAVAASLVNGDSLIKKNSLSGNRLRNHSVTGKQINPSKLGKVPSATNADSATNASNSSNLGGSPASSYERFGSTLPSGRSESGDYGIRVPTTGSTNFLDTAASFPIPLAAHVNGSHVVFTTVSAPVTHCSGPGHADAGYLCIYEDHHNSVTDPPLVAEYEDGSLSLGTGNFGFDLEWDVTGASPYSFGTWTVTAP